MWNLTLLGTSDHSLGRCTRHYFVFFYYRPFNYSSSSLGTGCHFYCVLNSIYSLSFRLARNTLKDRRNRAVIAFTLSLLLILKAKLFSRNSLQLYQFAIVRLRHRGFVVVLHVGSWGGGSPNILDLDFLDRHHCSWGIPEVLCGPPLEGRYHATRCHTGADRESQHRAPLNVFRVRHPTFSKGLWR